jgi:hypothetical protein
MEPSGAEGEGARARIFSTENGLRMMYWTSRSRSPRWADSTRWLAWVHVPKSKPPEPLTLMGDPFTFLFGPSF